MNRTGLGILLVLWSCTAHQSIAQQHPPLWSVYDDILGAQVYTIEAESLGGLLLGTDNGLYRFDGSSATMIPTPLDGQPVTMIVLSSEGMAWISGPDGGLHWFNQDVWQSFSTADNLSSNTITTLLTTGQVGEYWVGTSEGLDLVRFTPSGITVELSGLIGVEVLDLLMTEGGTTLAATSTDGVYARSRDEYWVPLSISGLPSRNLLGLVSSDEIYIVSQDGVCKLTTDQCDMVSTPTPVYDAFASPSGLGVLAEVGVWSVANKTFPTLETTLPWQLSSPTARGDLWIATVSGELSLVSDASSGEATVLESGVQATDAVYTRNQGLVWIDTMGQIWAGNERSAPSFIGGITDSGLLTVDPAGDVVWQIDREGAKEIIAGGTRTGNSYTFVPPLSAAARVTASAWADDTSLLIATTEGLYTLDPTAGLSLERSLTTNMQTPTHVAVVGRDVAIASERGVIQFSRLNEETAPRSVSLDASVVGLTKDPRFDPWFVATPEALYLVAEQKTIALGDAVTERLGTISGLGFVPNGHIWVSGSRGIISFSASEAIDAERVISASIQPVREGPVRYLRTHGTVGATWIHPNAIAAFDWDKETTLPAPQLSSIATDVERKTSLQFSNGPHRLTGQRLVASFSAPLGHALQGVQLQVNVANSGWFSLPRNVYSYTRDQNIGGSLLLQARFVNAHGVAGPSSTYSLYIDNPSTPLTTPILVALALLFAGLGVGLVWRTNRQHQDRIAALGAQIDEARRDTAQIAAVRDDLLGQIIPSSLHGRIGEGEADRLDVFFDASVLVCEIAEFEQLLVDIGPEDAVTVVRMLFNRIDRLLPKYHLEKVTSLGNRYLAVGGINPSGSHVDETAALALKLHQVAREVGRERDVALSLQIGLDVGQVVAGLIGQRRLRFDIWGETVSRAGSLQHRASAGQTLCSSNIRDRLSKPELCRYIDMLHAAGNQPMRVYHLEPPKSRVVQAEPSFDIASS